jgi:hypothetical protein
MRAHLEKWYDAGYAIGSIRRLPGGYYEATTEFIQAQKARFEGREKVGQVGNVISGR